MSFPGGGKLPDHMTDNDVERRIQEEIRIRQQNKNILSATRAYSENGTAPIGGGTTQPSAAEQQAHHNMMNLMAEQQQQGNSPNVADAHAAYYAHQRAYGGQQQQQQQQAYGGMDAAAMYARHQAQQAQQAATAAIYGYAPGRSGGYGGYGHHASGPGSGADLYSQQMAMASMDQHHGHANAYGHQQHHQHLQQQQQHHMTPSKLSSSMNSSIGGSPPGGQTSIPSLGSTPLPVDLQGSPAISAIGGSGQKPSPTSAMMAGGGIIDTPPMIPTTPIATSSSMSMSMSMGMGMGIGMGGGGGVTSSSTRATTTTKKSTAKKKKDPHETVELDDLKIDKWYSGDVPLGLDDDKYWLSELQVYMRANFAESFGATEEDIAAPMHGRNKPIALGQVGIRCMHCKFENPAERGQQATSYPSLISGIYNSVQQMLRLHLDCCQSMPLEIRAKIEALKVSSSSRGGRKQYWVDSAKRLGLVDTRHGIHFGRDPLGPLPPLTGPSVNSKEGRKKKEAQKKTAIPLPPPEEEEPEPPPPVDDRPLVFPEDEDLISDYLYLTLEQMSPCVLMEADRVGCYKGRKVGFPGLACKHCVGQAGCGRYFPASEASLSQTTTSQTVMNHVRNCRRCPMEIRENLELMKRARMGPDGKRLDKPKHGGRKVFFRRLWCRIQGLPIDEEGERKGKKKRYRKPGVKPRKKKSEDDVDDGSDAEEDDSQDVKETRKISSATSSGDETETESSEGESDDEDGQPESSSRSKKNGNKNKQSPWFDGCVRLTKHDDSNWLSELQCFARSDLVEVFCWHEEDGLEGCSGRKQPSDGQVGIRCVFCKTLEDSEVRSGCVVFPEDLESISTKTGDLLRFHFKSCHAMPDDKKDTFKSLRNFGPKVDESQQYWADSARDIGLADIPPPNGWGITFRRDPLHPSPSDELDRENISGTGSTLSNMYLIRPEDREQCTDQVLLMMRQLKVCQFQQSDRRGGPGGRGRDRVADFPGLACKHCANKNNIGRYFPVSAKNLTDNTANSMLSHVAACSRCPEPIKASIAYLSHRAIHQKTELSGSWKKAFFKKIWERLHVERAWVEAIQEEGEDGGESVSSGESDNADDHLLGEYAGKGGDDDSGSENGERGGGGNMDALINAAAIWLTEQDQTNDGSTSGGKGGGRGRSLPSKRTATKDRESPLKGNQSFSSDEDAGKRRRTHF